MNISNKLFITLVGLTCFILATTFLLTRWSFEQGFKNFYLGIEKQRLEALSTEIAELYTSSGSNWDEVRQRALNNVLSGRRVGGPPPRPRPAERTDAPSSEPAKNRPRNLPGHRRPPPTSLYNESGKLIAGSSDNQYYKAISIPIVIDETKIGELKSYPNPVISWELATAFSKQQLLTSLWITALGIILSSIVAIFLTKHLLKPILTIRQQLSLLTKGDYSSEVNVQRKDELGLLLSDIATLTHTLDLTRTANKRWIADISHELRTPLTILSGEIEALKAGFRPLNEEALCSIEQEVQRLSSIVNDLYQLSLADIGGLKYNFANEEINPTLAQAMACCEIAAEEKNIDIQFTNPKPVIARIDAGRIEQLFLNLLNNAIAYTDSPGQVHVSLKKVGENAVIEFEDSAPGIESDNYEHIFEPLFREDKSRVRRGSGAGLGLSICKKIVEAHRGKICAQPSSLGGLKTTVILPTGA